MSKFIGHLIQRLEKPPTLPLISDKGWRSSWLLNNLLMIIIPKCNYSSTKSFGATILNSVRLDQRGTSLCDYGTCCSCSCILVWLGVSWLHLTSILVSWALSLGQSASLRWSSREASLDTDALFTDMASVSMEKSWVKKTCVSRDWCILNCLLTFNFSVKQLSYTPVRNVFISVIFAVHPICYKLVKMHLPLSTTLMCLTFWCVF